MAFTGPMPAFRRSASKVAASRRRPLPDALERRRLTAQNFVKTHTTIIADTGLEVGHEALVLRSHDLFSYQGIEIEIEIDASLRRKFTTLEIDDVCLNEPEQAEAYLVNVRDAMSLDATRQLEDAKAALRVLIDTVLDDKWVRWLGGSADVAQRYLSFPKALTAHDAKAVAASRLEEAQAESDRVKEKSVALRLASSPDARLRSRVLRNRYRHVFPFLSGTLAPDLVVEKVLDRAAIDHLAQLSDEALPTAIDELLAPAKAALVAKIEQQILTLAQKARTLPHNELLSDVDIIKTVAAHYAGLDRALKKRRARHALVAIEEKAREAKYLGDVERLNEHRADYADVAQYYPAARGLGRKLILYVGPTNSGKTWRALNELAAGQSGVYLAPLRLLALEGQEELEKRGKRCSFLTGEERDLREDAAFISSTIEMLNYDRLVDSVVVDEVQLLVDERRGWAWLGAVLGAPAKKVIMTGSPDCVDLVKQLASYLGEELEIHECQRFNELKVADSPIRLRDVTPGMAIVCFSRRDVLRIKETIESNSSYKVAVVYGNLSPQVRREEARRFRSGEADILVATDAIAMGLNLPIKEVLFYATEKFDGEGVRELTPSEIRQIGGRAGRYGLADFGMVHALTEHGLTLIRAAVRGLFEPLEPPFFVAPGPNHVRIIGQVLASNSLERILTFFERAMEFSDERFTRSNIDELSFLSSYVDQELPHLPVTDRLTIASAPVDIKSETVLGWFIERMLPAFRKADDWGTEDKSDLDELFEHVAAFEHDTAANSDELRGAEDYLKTLTVYAWLAYRYPDVFVRLEDCEQRRETVNAFIERSLRRAVVKCCVSCDARLPKEHKHRICDRCHARNRARAGSRRTVAAQNTRRRGRH